MAQLKLLYTFGDRLNGQYIRCSIAALQIIFAIVVTILYGIGLRRASIVRARAHPSWVFAVVAAALSILTCIIQSFFTIAKLVRCLWDFIIAVLWAACFEYFATCFLSGNGTDDTRAMTTSGIRMKAAAWIDLINMLLWLAAMVWCCLSDRREVSGTRLEHMGKLKKAQISDVQMEGRGMLGQSDQGSLADGGRLVLPSYNDLMKEEKKSGLGSITSFGDDSSSLNSHWPVSREWEQQLEETEQLDARDMERLQERNGEMAEKRGTAAKSDAYIVWTSM
ncbi:hypothetical protein K402DRAFT_398266 [Aulographum hederae CBS 113979]|uniref:MARVEL domain-containing protein n=1 Tax=Aulographum hederae CBS 113979 TaxID=1176131 RepID=A0A6G1GLE1_9PEZI|nr:hypothetical protein K402DRAFT_398266 [Aulographum hederae CBS 113979]